MNPVEPLERRCLLSAPPIVSDGMPSGDAVAGGAAAGAIQVSIDASRTSGVAPLAVFFDATSTTGLAGGDHVDAHFEWRFDAAGLDPRAARRTATGFVAAHVYETPGTYLATLIVRDASGAAAVAQTTIDVLAQPPGGWQTYCVSHSGTDTSCAAGAPGAIALAGVDQAR